MTAPSVLFLSPGIRPGSGGVADYCVHLSRALAAHGVECHLASWNEEAGDASAERTLFLSERHGTSVHEKTERLRVYLQRHSIEWVSLQFVNFGFARRGLIHGLAPALAPVLNGKRVHVFLHELWLGANRGAKLREKLWGAWQKRQLLQLLAALQPEAVCTNIELYQRQLARAGVDATVLPIFGNIPVSSTRADEFLMRQLNHAPTKGTRADHFCVGLFGAIYPDWPFHRVIPQVLQHAGNRQTVFVLFGRNGDTGAFCEYIASFPRAQVLVLGPLEPDTIDHVMNSMDLALASTPAEGIFKSGSAISFLERGVPTVAVHRGLENTNPPDEPSHPHLILADENLPRKLAARPRTEQRAQSLLPEVTQRYLDLFRSPVPTPDLA